MTSLIALYIEMTNYADGGGAVCNILWFNKTFVTVTYIILMWKLLKSSLDDWAAE